MSRVICAGHVNWDVTLYVDVLPAPDGETRVRSRRCAGGGSAANVATALADLGVASSVVGSVGDDAPGRRIRRDLGDCGVDLAGLIEVPGGRTATKYLVVDGRGEVIVLGADGVNEAMRPDDVDERAMARADHLHLTGQRPETAAALARAANDADVTVSFDPGRRLAERDFWATLARADVVFLNDREAASVCEARNAADWSCDDQVIVVKRGDDGAAVSAPDVTHVHPGFETAAVDTTGAGDAFAAGFIATALDGEGYRRALEVANACGALATRGVGARATPSRTAIDRFLARKPSA